MSYNGADDDSPLEFAGALNDASQVGYLIELGL
jgi:hypothetical protein